MHVYRLRRKRRFIKKVDDKTVSKKQIFPKVGNSKQQLTDNCKNTIENLLIYKWTCLQVEVKKKIVK